MTEEITTPAEAVTQPEEPTQPQAEIEEPSEANGKEPKTFTQEQYEAGVKRRLERERTKLRTEWEAEKSEAERQAKLSALERAKEEKSALERERDEAKAELERERRTYSLERQLVGKVVNVADALALIKPEHVSDDGTLDLEAFLDSRPYLKAEEPSPSPLRGMNSRPVPATPTSSFNETIRRRVGR